MQLPNPTWFVGCGNMAGAMVEGWRSAGVDLSGAVAIRPSGKAVEGLRTVTSLKEAGAAPNMVVLGFKPQQLDEVAPDLLPWLTSKTVIVSILAGAEAQSLRQRFGKGVIVRAMPNLPVSVRRGVTALYSEDANDEVRTRVGDAFSALGYAIWTETEQAFGWIGAVAGAGPAYVARFIDALAGAGADLGLSKPTATTIAIETMLGTAWMAAATGETMEDLARRVASPRGTTEAGLAVLDRDDGLRELIRKTIDAARRRSAELAAEARGEQVA
jgi:pyrroline-5-carboxylate reductase